MNAPDAITSNLDDSPAASISPDQPLVNLRDLGGMKVEGGAVKPRALWRSDDPTIAPREEITALASQGLKSVLDLRSTHEATASPHATAAELGISHHHLPLAEAAVNPLVLVSIAGSMRSPRDVGHWYAGLVRDHTAEVVQGLRVITATDGGVLFHCAAGKDRTGILAAVVLTLLGADRDVIAEDYEKTQDNLAAIFERLKQAAYLRNRKHHDADEDAKRAAEFFASEHPLLSAMAESMDSMLTELGGRSGLLDLISGHEEPGALLETLHGKLVESQSPMGPEGRQ